MVSVPKISASSDDPEDVPPQVQVVDRKLTWVAYLLHLLGGGGLFGLHRFYLGSYRSAKIQLAIGALSLLLPFFIGRNIIVDMLFYVAMTWYIVDLFLIPKMVREKNAIASETHSS